MPARYHSQLERRFSALVLSGLTLLVMVLTPAVGAPAITNLHQLTQTMSAGQQLGRDVDLEVIVCAASRPKVGVLIVQDATGIELLQLGHLGRDIQLGERIRIRQNACFVRKRDMGVELSATPIVSNDGLHPWAGGTGIATLSAGKIPVCVEWFNYWRTLGLDVLWAISNEAPRTIEASNLWHTVVTESGATNFLPGLRADYYEGSWDTIPDFNLLQPVATGMVTNFNLHTRPRNERVGIRFSGYLHVPRDGQYQFAVWSDDGSMLFLGDPNLPVVSLGHTNVPIAKASRLLGAEFSDLDERRWVTVEGRVSFVSRLGEGLKFDLGTDRQVISVRLADAAGLDPSALHHARIRVTGIGRGVMAGDQTAVLGKLFIASARNLTFMEPTSGQVEPMAPITSVAQIQGLPIERARQALPVRIRGTVTGGMNTSQERWMSFQDDTRGIFVRLNAISNAAPAFGELWEVAGHSGAGDFAPIVVADQVTRLGEGLLPLPVHPTWTELLNGSRDVQWAELTGLVTEVHSNTISLQMSEGRLDVELEGSFESELEPFQKAVVRIRGVLYAVWDRATREVRVGRVMMRNSDLSVDVPAPTDPFDAVLRSPRELLLFDAQASAFRPVKVRGQIVYADATQLFLEAEGTGLRLLPSGKVDVRPGELVEAVGYPDIGRAALLLREALLKKTGAAPLRPPRNLDEAGLDQSNPNSTRVRVEGKLLGWHAEQGALVFELQAGTRLILARLATTESSPLSLRAGSRLALVGVFVGRSYDRQIPNADKQSFALLLNSLADITVVTQPPWWTLPRLLALLGVLSVILIFTVVWNTQLRRLVEQRTDQLQHEVRERERVERQHAVETERSRIARDLHDDLGSSLTEISVLASTGQLPQATATGQSSLFQAIGSRARNLVSALEVIVWAVDPEDNTLQSLADYLTSYANDFFSHTAIACRFKVPVSCPPVTLEGRIRHDLLMSVKEAMNNVVRHANATEVEFRLSVIGSDLEIDIADNGKGIETGIFSTGHGLKNLSARLKKLGGNCLVEPRTGGGTIVRIRLPLGASAKAHLGQQASS
jgi:signal transduction histidine kinase